MAKRKPSTARPKVGWREADIVEALARRHPENEWAFFAQVRNGTGFQRETRMADAIAMNLWPSRGMEVHGFEVKVSRPDFLHELQQPEKADSIAKYCDRWWLAISSPDIVHSGELPAAWGLLVMDGDKLACRKEAPRLEAAPLDRAFVASLLRNQAECPNKDLEKRYQEGIDAGQAMAVRELRTLRDEVARFEADSGVKIHDNWSYGDVGKAVRAVALMSRQVREVQRAAEAARRIADGLQAILESSGLGVLIEKAEKAQE